MTETLSGKEKVDVPPSSSPKANSPLPASPQQTRIPIILRTPVKNKVKIVNLVKSDEYWKANIGYARKLAGACLLEENFPSLMELGVLSIFETLLSEEKCELQEAAAVGLMRLARRSESLVNVMAQSDTLRVAAATASAPGTSPSYLRCAMLALLTAACKHSSSTTCAVVRQGAALACVAAMKVPEDPRVAEGGARLAAALAACGREPGRALLAAGGLPLLVEHLRGGTPQVQLQCARALAALSCWTARASVAVAPKSLRSLVKRAATCGCGCRPRVPGGQWRAAAALAALAEAGTRSAEAVAAAGGAPLVAAAVALLGSSERPMARWAGSALLEALTRSSVSLCDLVAACGAVQPLVSEACILSEQPNEHPAALAVLPAAHALLNMTLLSERVAADLIRSCAAPRLASSATWKPPLPFCFSPSTVTTWNAMEELSATATLVLGAMAKHSPEHACAVLEHAGTSLLFLSTPARSQDRVREEKPPTFCCPDGKPPSYPPEDSDVHAARRAAAQQALCMCISQSLDLTLLTALTTASSAKVRRAARAQLLLLADESPAVRRIVARQPSNILDKLRRGTDVMLMPLDGMALMRGVQSFRADKNTLTMGWQPHQYFDELEEEKEELAETQHGTTVRDTFQPAVLRYYEHAPVPPKDAGAWPWPCVCQRFFVTLPPEEEIT